MLVAAKKFNVEKIRQQDLASMAGPPIAGEYGALRSSRASHYEKIESNWLNCRITPEIGSAVKPMAYREAIT